MRSLALFLLLTTPGVVAANPASIARRAEARRELAKTGTGHWVKQVWFEPRTGSIAGELQVRSRGKAVVVRAEVPVVKDGVPGVTVHQFVAGQASPLRSDEKAEAPTRETLKKVLTAVYHEALVPIGLGDLYEGALDAVGGHPSQDKTGLMRAAMRGAVKKLGDPWTAYYEPTGWQNTTSQLSNDGRVPVGVTMDGRNAKGIVFTHIAPGSAASKAGLAPQDRLLTIDGKPVTKVEDAIAVLRGLPGTTVNVQVERGGQRMTIPITRAPIPFVTTQLHGGIGVVRFGSFRQGTATEVRKAIADLEQQHGGALSGLVLDLRGNTGGYVAESARLANIFIGTGSLGSLRTRSGQISEDYPANATEATHEKLPLTVLVDKGTVSASEFVTSVFKDRGRAIVFGEQIYGKGVGQLNRIYPDGSGLRMTFTRWHVPSGAPLPHGTGILPDVSRATVDANLKARGVIAQDPVLEEAMFHLRQVPQR